MGNILTKCTFPTRNIMQDLVKNLAKIFNVSYISCKILARILQEHSNKFL